MTVEVYSTILIKVDAFLPQQLLLDLVTVPWLQSDSPFTINHPVPRQFVFFGTSMQHPDYLPGTAGIVRQGSHLAVGGHSSPRYSFDYVYHSLSKRSVFECFLPSASHARTDPDVFCQEANLPELRFS